MESHLSARQSSEDAGDGNLAGAARWRAEMPPVRSLEFKGDYS